MKVTARDAPASGQSRRLGFMLGETSVPEDFDRMGSEETAARHTQNDLFYSAASLWEIAVKRALGREDFHVEPRTLRRGLLENGYAELPVTGEHALSLDALPSLHKDPFDRILIAQSITEGITLLTAHPQVAKYSGPIRKF